ncbi:Bardet-Biedl syndrome 1 protein [Grus japonensis]|uniref:Bardet-Biedl syndrome 1 protein n=1 Tax=Grus japonensis TaxID=30415 RepID=A0ABC9XXK2_GRUJA
MAAEESSSLWLEAHDDPLAGLRSFPGCMALADLHGDGDHKLLVGSPLPPGGPRLSVIRGAGVVTTLTLPEAPAGLATFGSSAVAAGSALYVYRNLRPFYRYALPPHPPAPLERELWLQAAQGEMEPRLLKEMLEDLRDKAEVPLTARSLRLLALPPPDLAAFVELHKGRPLHRQAVVTCLGSLPRGGPEGTPHCPVLGTEDGDVLVLDPEAFTPLCQGWVPSPPAFVVPRGPGDGRCRLALACRDGTLYGLHRTRGRGRVLAALGSRPVGLLAQDGGVLAATAEGSLQAFTPQGRRRWSLPLPPVLALAGAELPGRGVGAALVALETRELRLYRDRTLLCTLRTQDVVTGLCFGRYGREDNTLIMTTRGGALSIRILRRRAELGGTHGCSPPPPAPACPSPPHPPLRGPGAAGARGRPSDARAVPAGAGGAAPRGRPGTGQGPRGGGGSRGGGTHHHPDRQRAGAGSPPAAAAPGAAPRGGPPAPNLLLLLRCHPPPRRLQPPCIKVPLLLPGLSYVVGTWLEPGGGPPGRLQVLVLRQGCDSPLLTAQVGLPPAGGLAPA